MFPTGGNISLKNPKNYYNVPFFAAVPSLQNFEFVDLGFVSLTKQLLPNTLNSTLTVSQPDAAG
jgi:hypothetical protein